MLKKIKSKFKCWGKKKTGIQHEPAAGTSPAPSLMTVPTNLPNAQSTSLLHDQVKPITRPSSSPVTKREHGKSKPSTPPALPQDPPPSYEFQPIMVSGASNSSSKMAPSGPSTLPTHEKRKYPTSQVGQPTSTSPATDAPSAAQAEPKWANNAVRVGVSLLKTLSVLTGAPTVDSFAESLREKRLVIGKDYLREYCARLMGMIGSVMEDGKSKASQQLKDNLKGLHSGLSIIYEEIIVCEEDEVVVERMSHRITQAVDSFVLINCISGAITMADALDNVGKNVLRQIIRELPRVEAAHNDYTSKKSGGCFEGTREGLLLEIAEWVCTPNNSQIYMLSGIAGTGKSTIAYTVSERAKNSGYLGASFFFSRDEAERSVADKFFTTIAFQLCLYDRTFAEAIETALLTERGAAAVTKDPSEQLDALIMNPLRPLVESRSSPIVIVVDALDECDDEDGPVVLVTLRRLVQELPCFKVIITTRPRPHLPPSPSVHQVFYLQDIEDKIINGDIQRYFTHTLSWAQVSVALPGLEDEWSASNDEIDALVRATGRLFIMASTAVRFILDTKAYDPRSQMDELKLEGRVSLQSLEKFYNVILRRAVPPKQATLAQRFKAVIGTILVAQEPLSVRMLGQLIQPWPPGAIKAVLVNLQSVIMINSDTPRIYHKSFFDFLTDTCHCAEELVIDLKAHHTRVAVRCFQIMNSNLKQNILNLGSSARFMDNHDGLEAESVKEARLRESIPPELRYACIYWANHVEEADANSAELIKELETFIMKHLLHWLEALSWIGKLELAYPALRGIPRFMKLSSESSGIIYDALYFIPKFYRRVRQSALHTYYSALPFTPTDCPLYKSYSQEMIHGLCRPEGVPPQWDPLISPFSQGSWVHRIVFSPDSSKFASRSHDRQKMWLCDAANGAPLRMYEGESTTIAKDFSVAAVSHDRSLTLWSLATNAPVATVAVSEKVVELALSSDGFRLAAGLSNGTVGLWDAWKGELVASIEGYASNKGQLEFSPNGRWFAFISDRGTLRLCDGENGGLVADLGHKSQRHLEFAFSRDGRRLASLVEEDGGNLLMLWDGDQKIAIGSAKNVGSKLAISEDGSLVATGGEKEVKLWSGNPVSLVETLDIGGTVYCLAMARGILAIGSFAGPALTLYDIDKRTIFSKFRHTPLCLALSPDGSRLASGNFGGILYDIPLLKASPESAEQERGYVTALAFSPDSSRFTSGYQDGTMEMWDTNRTDRPINSHKLHSREVNTLAFSHDGERFASGSVDFTVRLWDVKDCAPMGKLEYPFNDALMSLAFSPDLLATATSTNIILFDNKSHRFIDKLDQGSHYLSFSANGSLLASASHDLTRGVTVWDVADRVTIATFAVKSDPCKLIFSPDGTQLASRSTSEDGRFEFFDISNKRNLELTGLEDLSWVPSFMNGMLISWKSDVVDKDRLIGRFPGGDGDIVVLWIAQEFHVRISEVGSSMVALGSFDGQILFVRFPTTGIN